MITVVNFILFQLSWFAGVLGAANGIPWLGPIAVTLLVAYHLAKVPEPRVEAALLSAAAGIGVVFDSMLVAAGWVSYPTGQWHPMMAPYWIITMWIAFATTLNVSMKWLKNRHALAFVFGGVGGPLSYLAGVKLGAATFNNATLALAALSVGWAVIMPWLMSISTRLDGWRLDGRERVATSVEGAPSHV